ncbi:MAG: PIN domain-containing protein [Ferruginibacter sp.]
MIIIIDTNIIISACLNSRSELYQILFTTYKNIDFTTPDFTLEEIIHHQDEICLRAKKNIVLFQHNLSMLRDNLLILPTADLSTDNLLEARKLTYSIDIDDTIFVAFSIALDALLWTNDLKLYRALRRKNFTNVIRTKELKLILKGL